MLQIEHCYCHGQNPTEITQTAGRGSQGEHLEVKVPQDKSQGLGETLPVIYSRMSKKNKI